MGAGNFGISDALLVTFVAGSIVAAIIWCWRYMRQSRAATFGRCPECGLRLDIEPWNCPRCGAKIRSAEVRKNRQIDPAKVLASEPQPVPRRRIGESETPVSVFSSLESREVQLVKRYLVDHGVRCRTVLGEPVRILADQPPEPFSHVLVWSGDEATARQLIDQIRDDE